MPGQVMAVAEEIAEEPPRKKSKLPLLLGLVLAIAGGGAGFFAVQSGMILGSESGEAAAVEPTAEVATAMPDVAFVPIEPIIVSLGENANGRHLRFRAQLEVKAAHEKEVQDLMPRVVDVLNSYLRAMEPADLEANAVLARLRAQMLRRIQIVTGTGRVNDLLIMEFVLN